MTRYKIICFSVISIVTCSFLFYFQGHRNNVLFVEFPLTILSISWGVFIVALTWNYILKIKDITKKNKLKWFIESIKIFILIAFIIVPPNGYQKLLVNVLNSRVSEFLNENETKIAIGKIIKFESRKIGYGRNGSRKYFAIIEYYGNYKKIHQSLYDENSEYRIGQKFEIIYSREHPEMFKLKH